MRDRLFLKDMYMGSDGEDFRKDFITYLKEILEKGRWTCMSDHTLFLQGANRAIHEVIEEIEDTIPRGVGNGA